MSERLTTGDYLLGPEDLRRRELVWGVVREPPAPRYGHQTVVTRTTLAHHPRASVGGADLSGGSGVARNAVRDRTTKLEWYRTYGVRECWLVEPSRHAVVVVNMGVDPRSRRHFTGREAIQSAVLPDLVAEAEEFFS